MKRTLIFFFVIAISFPLRAQLKSSDLSGIWKIVLKNSGGKAAPPPQFLMLKFDSTYLWGVNADGTLPKEGVSGGRWLLTTEGEIEMISADSTMEARYYRPVGDWRYKLDATQKGKVKQRSQMLEMDIYLEKNR